MGVTAGARSPEGIFTIVWRARSICEGEAELRSWVSAVVRRITYLSDGIDEHQRQLMSFCQALLEEQISCVCQVILRVICKGLTYTFLLYCSPALCEVESMYQPKIKVGRCVVP